MSDWKVHILGPDDMVQASSDSLFAPGSLEDVRCRLSFIQASECNCDEGPHENALHDLANDDVPVLLSVIGRLDTELKTTRAQLDQALSLLSTEAPHCLEVKDGRDG